MKPKVDTRRILIFLSLAFGIAWLTGLVIYLTGGIAGSPLLIGNLTLAIALMAFPYMWAPAIANILTHWITRERWKSVGLRPHFKQGWPFWVLGWVLPALMTLFGAVIFFLIFPQYFDANLTALQSAILSSPILSNFTPWAVVAIEILVAMLISPLVNCLATFGEEFGWRGYLLPKLLPLGWKKTMLLMGVIWGMWHWPVIFMGYEFGFKYWGAPWVGPLLFIWITFCLGVFMAWIVIRGGSIWPSVIAHAAVNGIASISTLAIVGNPNVLLGPLPVGIIGSLGYALVALALFFSPGKQVTKMVSALQKEATTQNDLGVI